MSIALIFPAKEAGVVKNRCVQAEIFPCLLYSKFLVTALTWAIALPFTNFGHLLELNEIAQSGTVQHSEQPERLSHSVLVVLAIYRPLNVSPKSAKNHGL